MWCERAGERTNESRAMDDSQHAAQYAAAETLTRRGMEESIRLLDEQLSRVSQRCEREALQRREAERRCAQLSSELEGVRAEAAQTQHARTAEDSERVERERDRLDAVRKLDGAMSDRAVLEATTSELQGELDVMVQRLNAEGRARGALQESFALLERELAEVRERANQQRQQALDLGDAHRTLETQLRDALRASEDKSSEAAELSAALRDATSELQLLQRRHAAEAEARQGLQEADRLRGEELAEARRAAQMQQRVASELQQAEAELSASLQTARSQLQRALGERAELDREMRRATSAADQSTSRADEAERTRAEVQQALQRANEEGRELRSALEGLASRERLGEAQRAELAAANEHLRARLENEVRARTALEDALRMRGAARSGQPPPPVVPPPAVPPPVPKERESPGSYAAPPSAPSPATFVLPSAGGGGGSGGYGSGGGHANGGYGGGGYGAGYGAGYGLGSTGCESLSLAGGLGGSGSANGGAYGGANGAHGGSGRGLEGEAATADGAVTLARLQEEMRLQPRPSAFEPQLRAVREALADAHRAESSRSAAAVPTASVPPPAVGLADESAPPTSRAPPVSSPLETRKQELSDELRRLKARLNPMGPPPPRAPTQPRAAVADGPADQADGASLVNQCSAACSPVIGRGGGTSACTPATTLGPTGSMSAALSAAEVESLRPSARVDATSGLPGERRAEPPDPPLSPGHRNATLSGLEESQRQLEDKLAALKRKLEAEGGN